MRLALAILVLLVLAPAAQARPFDRDEMRAVELAHDYWGRGPTCPNGIAYEVVPSLGGFEGFAMPCRIRMATDGERFLLMCGIVAHEWGHLLGYGHLSEPGHVMSPITSPSPQCQREDTRRKRARCGRMHKRAQRRRCRRRVADDAFVIPT